jgi:hypothetical protein
MRRLSRRPPEQTAAGVVAGYVMKTGPDALEPLSGMAHFNGLLVTLERAGGSSGAGNG